ncbi:carbohydrate kinase family protein [Govanella unica]|uniref:Carbohydrate kinase family protein n=1 Tax=Govanella unica TaxID=2975056 RepID=A0A9X3Z708_9PROT|nr:carbohydrate kinase family protein [Govania unica]MDA5193667.1 carbohydrate kinase family protein [Govania unica]
MKAVTVGSAMIDIITLVPSEDIERVTMTNATASFLLLEQGRKVEAESITIHVGGGAVNASVSMSRLGLAAGIVAKIGQDLNGKKVRERLAAEKVAADHVIETDKGATGTAVMISSHDRNATIFTYRGANRLLLERDITPVLFAGADLVYVTALSDNSADCFPLILTLAREQGAFVTANPGIRQLTSRTQPFLESLQNIDLLTLNETEASALVPALAANAAARESLPHVDIARDAPQLLKKGLHFGGFDMGLATFFAIVRRLGPGRVLVTDGVHGAFLADESGIHHCPILKVQVAGTAGAGDAFASTFASFTAFGSAPELALRAATVNAASVVSFVDTQTGLLSRANVEARAAAFSERLPVRSWAWVAPEV